MSVVSIPDENIDYDSSFEVVDENTIEKIESLDETKSESFQFMSATGDATKEANIDSNEDSTPITTAIIGKWKPISSENLEDYFKVSNLSEICELAWEHGIVCYEMKDGDLHAHTQLYNKNLNATVLEVGQKIQNKNGTMDCHVENNSLNSIYFSEEKELWKVERFIKSGQLVIINKREQLQWCKRTYERVE
ncbi:hypothetical protein GCK72_006021 [Caenorhabditis remanei]|uniref:Uncharacterized protein n=1 Tax=Caenorhabditis remanei TaxID=31234 RepID=A0A6A5HF87_CAERE|nr:hypothetical protein GCK72_006021 [Caenorhabditis remanei]KAF1766065.1 hypothetical protein GCK72_006021 [Caenorhabditis remanei]